MTEFKEIFASKSGEIFGSFLDAKEEDAKQALTNWLIQELPKGKSLYDEILDTRHELAKILNDLVKYAK